jgi:ankyrin repeat protein
MANYSSAAVLAFLLVAPIAALPLPAAPPATGPATRPAEQSAERIKALTHAVRRQDRAKVKELLDAGVAPGPTAETSGSSPLREAVRMEDFETAELLLSRGADPNDRNQGDLPLVCAAYLGSPKMVEFLIDHGAKTEPGPGPMPLLAAVDQRRGDVVQLLLAKGAKVNATDGTGTAALHRAAFDGFPDMAKLLLAAGADVRARTRTAHTPLELAAVGKEITARRKDDPRTPSRLGAFDAVTRLLRDAEARPAARPATRPAE